MAVTLLAGHGQLSSFVYKYENVKFEKKIPKPPSNYTLSYSYTYKYNDKAKILCRCGAAFIKKDLSNNTEKIYFKAKIK